MKILRIGALIIGFLLFVGIAAAGYLIVLKKPAMAPPASIRVAMTPESIARGKYLFTISDCDGCHSARDFGRFGGPVIEGRRGEGFGFPKELGLPGRIFSRNITPDPETGLGQWSDGEKIRAIREGISRDGTPLFPMMPYWRFREMSDQDVQSLVAFLNTLPPVKHNVPRSQVDFPVSVLMKDEPRPAGHVPGPDRSNPARYGGYLANLSGCMECHTRSEKGKPAGPLLAGGERFAFPGTLVVSANITPDPQSGIGRWSEQDFIERFTQYREYAEHGSPQVGPESFTLMPWLLFCQYREDDLKAIFAFLRTQKPVYNPVDSHPLELISRR